MNIRDNKRGNGSPVSIEVQFVHRVSDSLSHLLLVFRHWSQAKMGVNDQGKDRGGSKTPHIPRVLLLFLEAASSSETSEFRRDILHRVVWVEEESAIWSWGSKREPESQWLDLIKPSGTYLLSCDCEDHDAGRSVLVLA